MSPRRVAPAGEIAKTFARCSAEGRAAFVGFVTAGDPSLETTERLLPALRDGGVDILELGVAFSDPIADGAVIQRASARALASGTTLAGVLALVRRNRKSFDRPIVLFSYFNPIHAWGELRFAADAAEAGVDGVLCVDLPPEEGGSLREALRARGVDVVQLIAPTTASQRVSRVIAASSGFVYYVSRAGVTGERGILSPTLPREVRALRRRSRLPVAVGFGVSTPEQVAAVGRIADGVVVGSALVRFIEENATRPDLPERCRERVRDLSSALREKAK